MPFSILPILILLLVFNTQLVDSTVAQEPINNMKPRIIVITDIGGNDTDDEQSMVRFLVYSNEFDVEGLIASADVNHNGNSTHPEMLREIIDLYGEVHENLILHDPDYPTADYLQGIVRQGQPMAAGWRDVSESIGPDKDTQASDLIIEVVDRDDPRPVNITVWGGTADLAQALWRIREDRSPEALSQFLSKLRVHAIADQDSTGPWIRENFPDLFYILNLAPDGHDPFTSAFRGMYRGGDHALVSRDWVDSKIRVDHGPLGERYPRDGTGVVGLKEGDTPSWFYFLNNGLQNPEMPSWGGWGGRFELRPSDTYYQDAQDTVGHVTNRMVTVSRWRQAYQNDFEARMDWTVLSYVDANHNPTIIVDQEPVFTVDAGSIVSIDASHSIDSDGDNLSFNWYYYHEPSTYPDVLHLDDTNSSVLSFTAPEVTTVQTIHLILSVIDDGTPNLTSYQRFVISVEPRNTSIDLNTEAVQQGITAQYFSGMQFDELVTTQIDPNIDFIWGEESPIPSMPPDIFSVRWSGWIVPEASENYTFYTIADDGVRLYINGQLIIDDWEGGAPRESRGTISLQAGQPYSIIVEYFENIRGAELRLEWSSPSVIREIIGPEHFFLPNTEATSESQTNEVIHILPLGDSITQGNIETNSYRRPLWFMLEEAGYEVDFVGSTTSNFEGDPPNPDFDVDHEGHWGWRSDEILAELPTWLEDYTPDFALIHLGTNDIFQGVSNETVLANLSQIISLLREDNPSVTILIAQLIPHTRGDHPSLEAFNEELTPWTDSLTNSDSVIIVVDQASGFDPTVDTYDGVHPNESGDEKMAIVWFQALSDILP
ncbi:MAG: DUF1593 domain-containing protein [Anaerolineae bacterium]|nr:DUF1593 domain-containing protein [Anaerolineae bacterium]